IATLCEPGSATVIGTRARFPAQYAALANANAAHTLDLDDTHAASSLHPGAPVIPAALAVAETTGATGRALLAGIVAGYDVIVAIGRVADPRTEYALGFHPTATAGIFGATAAVAAVLGSSAGVVENAFGINVSQAAGTLQFLANGAWTKRLQVGLTAHNAILAHRFAVGGIVGATGALEGPHGFFHAYCAGADARRLPALLHEAHAVETTGIKPYPCCRYAHSAIDAVASLALEHDLSEREIRSVRIAIPPAGMELIGRPSEAKRHPQTVVDGQFSMHFLAAVAALRRGVAWSDYGLLDDPGVIELMERIEVVEDSGLTGPMGCAVELIARDQTHRRAVTEPPGEPERPLSWNALVAKFDDLASVRFDQRRRADIVAAIRALDTFPDVRALTALLGE
ncbi:MAG: MmgE/PrpD family protein, partial [Vulcanimicrobiaceae bacterium]